MGRVIRVQRGTPAEVEAGGPVPGLGADLHVQEEGRPDPGDTLGTPS